MLPPLSLSLWDEIFFLFLIGILVTFQGEKINTFVQSTILNKELEIDVYYLCALLKHYRC